MKGRPWRDRWRDLLWIVAAVTVVHLGSKLTGVELSTWYAGLVGLLIGELRDTKWRLRHD